MSFEHQVLVLVTLCLYSAMAGFWVARWAFKRPRWPWYMLVRKLTPEQVDQMEFRLVSKGMASGKRYRIYRRKDESPAIESLVSGRVFAIEWQTLLTLVVSAGIDEEQKK